MVKPVSYLNQLKPYQPNKQNVSIKLDANESKPYIKFKPIDFNQLDLSLYPDPDTLELKTKLAEINQISTEQLIVGNGSSELIFKLIQAYVEVDESIIIPVPTFSMYSIYAKSLGRKVIEFKMNADFILDIDLFIKTIEKENPKIIFLCSPNNPTGLSIKTKDIQRIIKHTQSLVVLDEAYIEFSDQPSLIHSIEEFPNLVILRTFSKAFGLAGIRLGYMISSKAISSDVKRLISPYHLNQVTQKIGTLALDLYDQMHAFVSSVKEERNKLFKSFKDLGLNFYPSDGNFILIASNGINFDEELLRKGILIRKIVYQDKTYFRITVGDPIENTILVMKLKEILYEKN